jgi:hypothetical protein
VNENYKTMKKDTEELEDGKDLPYSWVIRIL